jgi:hypothetical protein
MRLCLPIATTALLAVCAVRPGQSAEIDLRAFVGTWKENAAKSHAVISSTLTYTFTELADRFIQIERAGVQLGDRVRFDGKDYPTPGVAGRSASWTKVGDTVYENTLSRDGAVVATGKWTLSDDGTRLTQVTIPRRANGDNDANIIEYVRTSGEGKSLIGVWKPVSSRSVVPDLFVITVIADGELNVFYPKYQSSYTIRPDGKQYAFTLVNALPGTRAAAETLASRTLRRTTFRGQTSTLETVMAVSTDGKTMTVTTHVPGSAEEPSSFVYEKQD